LGDNAELVSVILPTYNGSHYIRESINSCLAQTHENIEVIIVDDGSTDETPQVIASYNDKRIKYIRHETNKGLPNALNTGFSNATGPYLTWTSDDNYYAETAIERMLSFSKEKNCPFVYCDYFFIFEDTSPMKRAYLPDLIDLKRSNDVGCCFLYINEVMKTVGQYDPATKLAEDYDYWIRVSKKYRLCHLGEPLYYYRVHKKSLYVSKYIEVKIVDFLVRLKNDMLNAEEITNLFLDLIATKNNGIYQIDSIIVKAVFASKIKHILREYKENRKNFTETKGELSAVVDRRNVLLKLTRAAKVLADYIRGKV
jgi:glycosyltransferase involved in cell wall biosynthesis